MENKAAVGVGLRVGADTDSAYPFLGKVPIPRTIAIRITLGGSKGQLWSYELICRAPWSRFYVCDGGRVHKLVFVITVVTFVETLFSEQPGKWCHAFWRLPVLLSIIGFSYSSHTSAHIAVLCHREGISVGRGFVDLV